MCDPRTLCRRHLLGEHGELHKHRHVFEKKYSIAGRTGQIEPRAMETRHDELAAEMLQRGYNHNSPYDQPDLTGYDLTGHTVARDEALRELLRRCDACRERLDLFRKKQGGLR